MTRSERKHSQRLQRALKDKQLHWYSRRLNLAASAHRMRKKAVSWRGFHVGSAGIGVRANGELVEYTGFNVKQQEGPRQHDDHCAEPHLIADAKQDGCVELFGIATEAPYQVDDFSGLDLGVTTMCIHCRRMLHRELKDPESPVKKDTLLFFVNGDNREKHVQFTVEQLLRLYKDAE